MDRPRGDRRDPGGGDLGIYCFPHQQPRPPRAGEDHGRRCPVPAIPWQRRLQRSSFVYRGSGALLCRDRRRNPEFLAATQTQDDSHQGGEGKPDSDAIDRTHAADCSAALTTSGCACSGVSFGALVADYVRDRAGPRSCDSSGSTSANNGITASAVARSILVAT